MANVSINMVCTGTQFIFAALITEAHIIVPGLKTASIFAMCIVTPDMVLRHHQLINQPISLPISLPGGGTGDGNQIHVFLTRTKLKRRNKMMKVIFKWKHLRCRTIEHKSISTLELKIMVAVSHFRSLSQQLYMHRYILTKYL